ncbi:hypothetical protein DRQ11_04860 [candidate division KSB1 bacterium]|nr:MAG: hypothetical protein DRQ11_04860 [candidate division KSB1 bacterium]
MKFIRDSIGTFAAQATVFLSKFFTGIITARVLGPEGKGVYTIVILVYTVATLIGNFGIGNANVYLIGRRKLKTEEVVTNSLFLSLVIGIGIIFLFWGTHSYLENSVFQNVEPRFLYTIIITTPFALMVLYLGNIFQAMDQFVKFNVVEVLRAGTRLILIAAALLALKLGVLGAVESWVIAEIAAAGFALYLLLKILSPKWKLNLNGIKSTLSFGLRSYAELFFLYLNYQIDMIMVAYFTEPKQVGYYSIAFAISRMILILPTSIGIVLYPKLSTFPEQKGDEFTALVCRHIVFIIVLILLIIGIFSTSIIKLLYGTAFLPSVTSLLILLPGTLAISIYKQLTRNFLSRGKPQWGAYLSIIGLAIAISLDVLLIPRYGIAGGAFASSISFITMSIGALYLFTKTSRVPLLNTLFITPRDVKFYSQKVGLR